MAHLVLMCGLPCSGKTTLAKHLEIELKAIRLTPDEWIVAAMGQHPDRKMLDDARDPMEAILWRLGLQALELGVNVIQDFGVWSLEERERFRAEVAQVGASSEIRYMDVSLEELLARLERRNADLPPGDFPMSADDLRRNYAIFQAPTPEECLLRFPEG